MTNSLPWDSWPIEIDGLPWFAYVANNQRVIPNINLPIVPHKAAAEVSQIGNL